MSQKHRSTRKLTSKHLTYVADEELDAIEASTVAAVPAPTALNTLPGAPASEPESLTEGSSEPQTQQQSPTQPAVTAAAAEMGENDHGVSDFTNSGHLKFQAAKSRVMAKVKDTAWHCCH
eukprot:SAG11_NODE_5303_length_1602_cov_1.145709_2_plen_120_part_00